MLGFTDYKKSGHSIKSVTHFSEVLSCVVLIAVVGGARPRLRAAFAQRGAPHVPWVVGSTHLGGSWW